MGKWVYGDAGWFATDLAIALAFLDEKGLLEQKYNPVRLGGRRFQAERTEALHRSVKAEMAERRREPEIIIIDDPEPDLMAEHVALKAMARKHHAASRYQKVRKGQRYDVWDKRVAKRAIKGCLNKFAEQDAEADIIREYRSTWSDAEPYSRQGMRDMHW